MVRCPVCRKTAQVPDKGPADLPTAFIINSFMEIEKQLKKVSAKNKQASCDNCSESNATSFCKQCATSFCDSCLDHHNKLKSNVVHQIMDMKDVVIATSLLLPVKEEADVACTNHNESLKVYCETCQEPICQICTISRHKDHNYNVLSEIFPKHQHDIKKVLEVTVNKMFALQEVLTAITTREDEVAKQRDGRINEIHIQAQHVVDLVFKAGEQLIETVNSIAQYKLQLLGQQREEAELALVQLKSCKEFVEKSLEIGSQQQILSEKKSMIKGMEIVSTQINPDVFQPVEEANIVFTENKKLVESCNNIGTVNYSFSPVRSNLSITVPPMCHRKTTVAFSLQTKLGSPYEIPSSNSSLPLTCHLISGDTGQAIVCDLEETEVGKYSVSFTPLACGKHQLKIKIGSINIDASSFHVVPSPEMRDKPVKAISRLNEPWGIAVDKKTQLIVVEHSSHCITVYDKEGKKLQSFGTKGKKAGQFTKPKGVAVTDDGHILVTDEHRLQKLTPEGHCVMSVGSSKAGSGPLQFRTPVGIAIHPTKELVYVADECNHRIQVINGDFTYSHSIGSKGTAPGQLYNPYDVALDNVGNVYVADYGNNCIDIFTSDGEYLRSFGNEKSNGCQLFGPTSITIDAHNMVYVAERANHRISVFTTDGVFIKHFCQQGLQSGLYGTTLDTFGNLYVSDRFEKRVVLL